MILDLNPGSKKEVYEKLKIIPIYNREVTRLVKPQDYLIYSGKNFKELENASKFSNAILLNPTLFDKFYKETGLIGIFKNNKSYVELPLNVLLNSEKYLSANLNKFRQFYLEAYRKKIGIVMTCKCDKEYQVKTEMERKSILVTIGFKEEQAYEIIRKSSLKFLAENSNSTEILEKLGLMKEKKNG